MTRILRMTDLADKRLRYAAFYEYYLELKTGERLVTQAINLANEPGDEPEWQLYDAAGEQSFAKVTPRLAEHLNALARDKLGGCDPDAQGQMTRDVMLAV